MLSSIRLLLPVITTIIGTIFARSFRRRFAHLRSQEGRDQAHFWARLENVGVPSNGIFAHTRALISSLKSVKSWTHNGYNRISKAQKLPFALPTIWTGNNVAVLPPSVLRLLTKPESELRAFGAQLETIQLPYMISDRDIYMNVFHFDVVRKHLVSSKDVASLAAATDDEVDAAFADVWGTSTEWKTTNAWDACGRIITRAAIRVLIGLPICRDENYFEQSRLFSDSVIIGTAMINTLPPVLRPIIGPLIALRAKYYQRRCLKILVPFVEERIRIWRNGEKEKEDSDVPNDFLQWLIPKCAKEGPEQMDPTKMANRLLTFNVMFVIGMVYVFAHCVLDLYGSPDRGDFISGLEAECRQVSATYDGLASKEAVDRLHRVDSVIRESMRVSDIAVTALARDVVGKPLDLGNGIQVPRGTRVVFPTQAIHQDADNYADPLRFDAFRFSRPFEGISTPTDNLSSSNSHRSNENERGDGKQNGADRIAGVGKEESQRDCLTTITSSFLAFGYGKHACPGRWFASQTMKQALAGALLNYDIEITNKPRTRQVLLNMMVPAVDAQMRFRRKVKS